MYTVRESWTDERLDDFAKHVDHRFDEVDRRFDEVNRRFGEMNHRFDNVDHELHRLSDRLDGMHKALIFAILAYTSAMIAAYGSVLALVLTRT